MSTEEPIIVKRGKFSPEVEAQDLMAGDWENLAELETHAVEVIGEAFDEGFRKGVTDERQRVSESALRRLPHQHLRRRLRSLRLGEFDREHDC